MTPTESKKIISSPHRGGGLRWGGEIHDVHPSPSQRLSEPAAIPTFPHRKGEGGEMRNRFVLIE